MNDMFISAFGIMSPLWFHETCNSASKLLVNENQGPNWLVPFFISDWLSLLSSQFLQRLELWRKEVSRQTPHTNTLILQTTKAAMWFSLALKPPDCNLKQRRTAVSKKLLWRSLSLPVSEQQWSKYLQNRWHTNYGYTNNSDTPRITTSTTTSPAVVC